MNIKRIFHDYRDWEDYKNGMFSKNNIDDINIIRKVARLLSNEMMFYTNGKDMLRYYKKSAEHNLTNPSRNKQAWIGQATASYMFKACEENIKRAWNEFMTDDQRIKANQIADKLITEWEVENYGSC